MSVCAVRLSNSKFTTHPMDMYGSFLHHLNGQPQVSTFHCYQTYSQEFTMNDVMRLQRFATFYQNMHLKNTGELLQLISDGLQNTGSI